MAHVTAGPPGPGILRRIFAPAHRANPYPLWAKLRQTPVCWQEDGPEREERVAAGATRRASATRASEAIASP